MTINASLRLVGVALPDLWTRLLGVEPKRSALGCSVVHPDGTIATGPSSEENRWLASTANRCSPGVESHLMLALDWLETVGGMDCLSEGGNTGSIALWYEPDALGGSCVLPVSVLHRMGRARVPTRIVFVGECSEERDASIQETPEDSIPFHRAYIAVAVEESSDRAIMIAARLRRLGLTSAAVSWPTPDFGWSPAPHRALWLGSTADTAIPNDPDAQMLALLDWLARLRADGILDLDEVSVRIAFGCGSFDATAANV